MSEGRVLSGARRFLQGNSLVFAATDLLGNFARGLVLPYMSLYILALGGDTTQVGLVGSIAPRAGLGPIDRDQRREGLRQRACCVTGGDRCPFESTPTRPC